MTLSRSRTGLSPWEGPSFLNLSLTSGSASGSVPSYPCPSPPTSFHLGPGQTLLQPVPADQLGLFRCLTEGLLEDSQCPFCLTWLFMLLCLFYIYLLFLIFKFSYVVRNIIPLFGMPNKWVTCPSPHSCTEDPGTLTFEAALWTTLLYFLSKLLSSVTL